MNLAVDHVRRTVRPSTWEFVPNKILIRLVIGSVLYVDVQWWAYIYGQFLFDKSIKISYNVLISICPPLNDVSSTLFFYNDRLCS